MIKIIKIAVSIIIFMTLYHYAQIQPDLFYAIIYAPASTAVVIVLCLFLVLLHAWRWYRLNSALRIPLFFKQTIMPTYLGNAFNALLPGSIGGDIYRLYVVGKGFPGLKTEAALAVVVDRLSGLVGVIIITAFTAAYYLAVSDYNGPIRDLMIGCLLIALFVATFVVLLGVIPIARLSFMQRALILLKSTRFRKTVETLLTL
jgi:hypothetical protein